MTKVLKNGDKNKGRVGDNILTFLSYCKSDKQRRILVILKVLQKQSSLNRNEIRTSFFPYGILYYSHIFYSKLAEQTLLACSDFVPFTILCTVNEQLFSHTSNRA